MEPASKDERDEAGTDHGSVVYLQWRRHPYEPDSGGGGQHKDGAVPHKRRHGSGADGDDTAAYVRGMGYIAKIGASNDVHYYQYNAHGDVVQVASGASGEVENRYDYDAFGEEILAVEETPNDIRYSGEFYDAAAGLYYLRARYYDPATGRFTQEDTYRGDVMEPASLNLYAYCYNDPISYVDPSGHDPDNWWGYGPPPSSWAEIEGSFCGDEEDFQDYIDRSGRREEYEDYQARKQAVNDPSDPYWSTPSKFNTIEELNQQWREIFIAPYVILPDAPIGSDDDPNIYGNAVYTKDALKNWLRQTGGKVNIIIYLRDLVFDGENIEEFNQTSITMQANIITLVIEAYNELTDEEKERIVLPQFFLDTSTFSSEILDDEGKVYQQNVAALHTGILSTVSENTGLQINEVDALIGGFYFGEENPINKNGDQREKRVYASMVATSKYVHAIGKEFLWIPYFYEGSGDEKDQQLKNIAAIADEGDNGETIFDTVILQPGLFYREGNEQGAEYDEYLERKMIDILDSVTENRIMLGGSPIVESKKTKTKIGVEFEFDSSVYTGRTGTQDQRHYEDKLLTGQVATPADKWERFLKYADLYIDALDSRKVPVGFYIGGPNETAYDCIDKPNNYVNALDNHLPYYPGVQIDSSKRDENAVEVITEKIIPTGVKSYSEFEHAIPGYEGNNAIYDMMDALLNKQGPLNNIIRGEGR